MTNKNYDFNSFSDVRSNNIGEKTKIWQFCVILKDAKIGNNCNIGSHCYIENDVVIGDRVTIKNGVNIFDSILIEDDVFIGPNVTFTNEVYPSSKREEGKKLAKYPKTIIGKKAAIGGGATILPGIKIGEGALIGAGSVVAKDVEPYSLVYGGAATLRRKLKTK